MEFTVRDLKVVFDQCTFPAYNGLVFPKHWLFPWHYKANGRWHFIFNGYPYKADISGKHCLVYHRGKNLIQSCNKSSLKEHTLPQQPNKHTFAVDKLLEGAGSDISRRISSPSENPRPRVGTVGALERRAGGEEPFGTSDAAFGERRAPLFIEGVAGFTAPTVFCITLRKSQYDNVSVVNKHTKWIA